MLFYLLESDEIFLKIFLKQVGFVQRLINIGFKFTV